MFKPIKIISSKIPIPQITNNYRFVAKLIPFIPSSKSGMRYQPPITCSVDKKVRLNSHLKVRRETVI